MLCKEMGWTYQELMSQPRSFIEEIIEIIGITKKIEIKKHGGKRI